MILQTNLPQGRLQAKTPPPLRWQRFAQGIAQRHQPVVLRQPALAMILARLAAPGLSQTIYRYSPILQLALRMETDHRAPAGRPLTMAVDRAQAGASARPSPPEPAVLAQMPAAMLPLRRAYARLPGEAEAQPETTTESSPPGRARQSAAQPALKWARREERPAALAPEILPGAASGAPQASAPTSAVPGSSLPGQALRFRRSRPPSPSPATGEAEEQTWESADPRIRARHAPPGQPREAQINIEQLTEQVIRQIDNRIVAHSERTGRLF